MVKNIILVLKASLMVLLINQPPKVDRVVNKNLIYFFPFLGTKDQLSLYFHIVVRMQTTFFFSSLFVYIHFVLSTTFFFK